MDNKQEIISNLEEVFIRWQKLIGSLSVKQIMIPLTPSNWTSKDVLAHLWSWQQASVARAEAALENKEPHYPDWWIACGPDPNEDVDRTNAFLYAASRDKAWDIVYADWEKQFAHYLELLKQVPEDDLLEEGRFAWMAPYALSASAMGSWDHHQEHYDSLIAWFTDHGELLDRV